MLVASGGSASAVGAVPGADWPTYHGDNLRSGTAAGLKTLTAKPRITSGVTLDGAVYGSPIVIGGSEYVATENNSVYRIVNGRVIWKDHLRAPVPQSKLACGNINPLGATGTPAYDPVTKTIVVVAEIDNPIRHQAWGLDPATGRGRWTRQVDVPASVGGINPAAMQQRGAITIVGGRAYIPFGGLAGDCGSYRGSFTGVVLSNPNAPLYSFTVPTAREGGIWTPPGLTVDPRGGILVSVGNGATTTSGAYDHSDSILKIGSGARIVDSFSPASWRTDNANDLDLGSQGPAIVGNFIFAAGKSGTAYVLNRARLGGIGGQVSQTSLCRSFGGTAVSGNVVYVPCTDGLRAVRINSNGTLTVLWHAASSITGSPVVGAGAVFSLDTSAGVLNILNPANGAVRYAIPVGRVTRFATPALSGNSVYIGTATGARTYSW